MPACDRSPVNSSQRDLATSARNCGLNYECDVGFRNIFQAPTMQYQPLLHYPTKHERRIKPAIASLAFRLTPTGELGKHFVGSHDIRE